MSLRRLSFRKSSKQKSTANQYKTVFVHLLDKNQDPLEIDLDDFMNGTILLERVCELLGGIVEKDYFGLRYKYKDQHKRWLDGSRGVHHQIKKAKTSKLSFRVKHYPRNPVDDIKQDIVRYFFYLQLRRDLLLGNLLIKGEMLIKLISLVIQAEHGDITDPTHAQVLQLVTDLHIVENVTSNTVDDVCKCIVTLNELDGKDAEKQFLVIVSQLESYGVEPYLVVDRTGEKSFLTMNHQGICIFSGEKRKHIFYWENISKLMFIRRSFLFENNIENKKKLLEFKLTHDYLAKEFWKWATDRQYFMTLNNSSEAKKVHSNNWLFSRKITHKFSGKSLKELNTSCQTLNDVPQPEIIRSRNPTMTRSNSFKAICRNSVNLENHETNIDLYATMPRGSKVDKDISILAMNFQNDVESKIEPLTSTVSEESIMIASQHGEIEDRELELPVIAEDKIIEEAIEANEFKLVQQLFSTIDQAVKESDEDTDVRERRVEPDEEVVKTRCTNGPLTDRDPLESSEVDDNYRVHNVDGMFFVKFVILTTLILLVVMVTSLVAYYYYRSSTIADLNKQKYSTEWNKNIDLESIKRFVLRNDAP